MDARRGASAATCRLLAVLLLLLAACSRSTTPLPELPALSLDGLPEASRNQIRAAWDTARAAPADAAAAGRLGMILQATEQFASAVPCYRRARLLAPDDQRWTYYLAVTQAALHQWEDAADTLEQFLAAESGYLPARLLLAQARFSLGQLDRAHAAYEQIARDHPQSFEAAYGLGRVLQAQHRLEEAVAQFRQACDLVPRCGPARYALGLALRDLGRSAEAERHLAAYRRDPDAVVQVPDPLLAEVAALRRADPLAVLRRAVALDAAGDTRGAVRELEDALTVTPGLLQARIDLVALYGRLGDLARARETYQTAAAAHPGSADLHHNWGTVLLGQGQLAEARQAFERALAANPAHAEARLNLGQTLERMGRPGPALDEYRRTVEHQPAFRLARFHLARLLLDAGRPAEARDTLLAALTPEDGDTPLYLLALASAYRRAGDRERAAESLERAQALAAAFERSDLLAAIDRERRLWTTEH